MEVQWGVGTYHCRLAGAEISLEEVLREVAALVQLNAVHLRDRAPERLAASLDVPRKILGTP